MSLSHGVRSFATAAGFRDAGVFDRGRERSPAIRQSRPLKNTPRQRSEEGGGSTTRPAVRGLLCFDASRPGVYWVGWSDKKAEKGSSGTCVFTLRLDSEA
jgi:hypothetical protein